MSEIVITHYARSPFTPARRGALARVRPDDIAAQTVKALVERAGIDPNTIEDVLLGCAFPEGEQGFNLARIVGLMAGLPITTGGATVNRFCGSSMQAIHMAAGAILLGAGDCFVCAGVESMTRVPIAGFNPLPNPAFYKSHPEAYMAMGETAENIAKRWEISHSQQEEFALHSQKKAAHAQTAEHFVEEIVPITDPSSGKVIDKDGCIRGDTTAEDLAGLKPAFAADGVVTAGTSSPLTDGAAAVLVCSAEYARTHNLEPLARINSVAISGCDPSIMGIGLVGATRKALTRAGLAIGDIDLIELNEAFAVQSLACIHDLELNPERINLDGGAIALGHPLGATGARIVGKAASLLKRTGGKHALATQCIGGGQGIATIISAA